MLDLKPAYENMGKLVVLALIGSLRKAGVKGSGGSASALEGSFSLKYGKGFQVYTEAEYWKYVEDGRRKGKMPPIKPLMEWIKWKGINASGIKGKTYDMKVKSLAFAMGKSIQKRGTIKRFGYKGTKFVEKAVDGKIISNLEDYLAKYIEDNL